MPRENKSSRHKRNASPPTHTQKNNAYKQCPAKQLIKLRTFIGQRSRSWGSKCSGLFGKTRIKGQHEMPFHHRQRCVISYVQLNGELTRALANAFCFCLWIHTHTCKLILRTCTYILLNAQANTHILKSVQGRRLSF